MGCPVRIYTMSSNSYFLTVWTPTQGFGFPFLSFMEKVDEYAAPQEPATDTIMLQQQ